MKKTKTIENPFADHSAIDTAEPLDSLSNASVMPPNENKLTDGWGTDTVLATVSDLSSRLEEISYVFCVEKDTMNHVFREFVEVYATMITRSNYIDLPTSAYVIFRCGVTL